MLVYRMTEVQSRVWERGGAKADALAQALAERLSPLIPGLLLVECEGGSPAVVVEGGAA
jgi:hypothetical protein